MTFQTNRLYYFCHRTFFKNLLIQLALGLFFLVHLLTDGQVSLETVLSLLTLLVVVNLLSLLALPKQFTLCEDHITLHAWLQKSRESGGVIRFGRSRGVPDYKKVNVIIRRITKIEVTYLGYIQARRVGTLRLHGEIHAKNNADDFVTDVTIPTHLDLHGVKDIESAISALQTAFPMAELAQMSRRDK